jgi:hypothetical protein
MAASRSDIEAALELRRWAEERHTPRKRAKTIAAVFGRTNFTRQARDAMDQALDAVGVSTAPSLIECHRDDWLALALEAVPRRSLKLPRVHWRFVAGPESLMAYELDKRRTVAAWTADRSGKARRGDLVALYATGRLQSYMGIARVCCKPVQNVEVSRRVADREWWTYLQIQPLRRTVPRGEVEAQGFSQRAGSGLQTPSGARSNRVADEIAEEAFDFLVGGDGGARETLKRWRAGQGAWPRALGVRDLRDADWNRPERSSPQELLLSRQIAKRLVASGRFRYVRDDDGLGTASARANDPTRLSLEHPIQDAAGRGRIDILLVDTQRPRTLLVIEVKLHATLAPGRDPIPQLIRYCNALTQEVGGRWTARPLIVAERLAEAVKLNADAHGIAYRSCSPKRGELRGDPL